MTDLTNAERDLVDAVLALSHVYNDMGVHVWLSGANDRWEGKSAIDLIRGGRGTDVVASAWQLADGGYA